MRKLFRHILTVAFLLCGLLSVQAKDYVFRNMVSSDGLSGLLVNTIYKDKDGFIWLGTDNGIDRFDGMRIRHYTFKDIGQDMKKRVNSIMVAAGGQLYAGNGYGLWAEDNRSGVLSMRFADEIKTSVNSLLEADGTLYAGTDKGLYIIRGGKVAVKRVEQNAWAGSNKITDIALDKHSQCLWLTTHDGLARYDLRRGAFKLYRQPGKAQSNYFRCLTMAGAELYVGTMTQGLLVFNPATGGFAKGPSVGSNVVSDISSNGGDLVYVATDGNGVHYVSRSKKDVVKSILHIPGNAKSISSNSVYSLLVDKDDMLFVGTYRTGLDYTLFHSDLFSVYQLAPDFTSANLTVNSVSINGGEKLIGTRDGLYYVNELTHSVRHFTTPQLTANLILSTLWYNGMFFIGTYGGGLMTLDPATMQLESFGGSLSGGHAFCLRTSPDGRLWIGTDSGLFCLDGTTGKLAKFSSANSQLSEGSVYAVTFDSTGKGWIGTEHGLCIIDAKTGTIRADVFPEGFANKDKIRGIYEDSRHDLFFVREKGDLFKSNTTMDKFGDVELPFLRTDMDNQVLSVIEDKSRNMWIACSDGLFRMTDVGGQAYDLYTFNDGLPSQTFTNNSALLDKNGLLWFGNSKGLVSVNPALLVKGGSLAGRKVLVTGVQVNGVEMADYSSLANSDNNITFCFSDMSFGAPGSTVYEYRLDGVDDGWRFAVATGQASYFGLKAGTYTFHVRTPGDASTEATVTLTIRPLVAWWGWALIVVAVAGLIYLIIYRRRAAKPAVEPAPVAPHASAEPAAPLPGQQQEKTSKALLSDKEAEMLKRRLTSCMEKDRPYVNKNLKSADIANNIGVSLNALSYVLNQYMHVSFNDFVNDYRVREFKRKASDERYSQLTLSALAEDCGFGSHASFFRAFKKITGITPNEYLHKAQKPFINE